MLFKAVADSTFAHVASNGIVAIFDHAHKTALGLELHALCSGKNHDKHQRHNNNEPKRILRNAEESEINNGNGSERAA